MSEIDWTKLHNATSQADEPTPGYLFNEIVTNVAHAKPTEIPVVASYLAKCVDGEHTHVKLKALFLIRELAYRVPPFCACMQEWMPSVRAAQKCTGPPSALFGDEPYRLVREAAENALKALTAGEHYDEEHKGLSQRIIGFGNYLPAEDTVLPDGSINVARDVTYVDITRNTVGFVQGALGSLVVGLKDLFAPEVGEGPGEVDTLGVSTDYCEDEVGGPDGAQVAAELANEQPEDPEDEDAKLDEDGVYHASKGSYVPPALPLACSSSDDAASGAGEASRSADAPEDDIFCPWAGAAAQRSAPSRAPRAAAGQPDLLGGSDFATGVDVYTEAAMLRVLGMPGAAPVSQPAVTPLVSTVPTVPMQSPAAEREPTEREMLDLLGIASHGAATPTSVSTPVSTSAAAPVSGSQLQALAGLSFPSLVATPQAEAPSTDLRKLSPRAAQAGDVQAAGLRHLSRHVPVLHGGGPGCAGPGMIEV